MRRARAIARLAYRRSGAKCLWRGHRQECECEKARAEQGAAFACLFHHGKTVAAVGRFRIGPQYIPCGVMWLCDDCGKDGKRERIQ